MKSTLLSLVHNKISRSIFTTSISFSEGESIDDLSAEKFPTWKETLTRCKNNFAGKSGSKDANAAVRMWQRSESRGYYYKHFIGDGVSSAYKTVCAINDGVGLYSLTTVVKEEYVYIVPKRIGKRLRHLKWDAKKDADIIFFILYYFSNKV